MGFVSATFITISIFTTHCKIKLEKVTCSILCFELAEVEVNLRPTVSRPVYPGIRRPSGTCDKFFFRHEISFRQLRLCYFVAPSLTRGRVCNLLLNCFWALPEQSLLSRSPAELTVHILLSHLRLPQPGGPGSRIYILEEQGGPVIPPGPGFEPNVFCWCVYIYIYIYIYTIVCILMFYLTTLSD
jgi:hypothetical protein